MLEDARVLGEAPGAAGGGVAVRDYFCCVFLPVRFFGGEREGVAMEVS